MSKTMTAAHGDDDDDGVRNAVEQDRDELRGFVNELSPDDIKAGDGLPNWLCATRRSLWLYQVCCRPRQQYCSNSDPGRIPVQACFRTPEPGVAKEEDPFGPV